MTGATRPIPPFSVEIGRLLAVAERDLTQARMCGLHPDTRFSLAYNAALQLATVVLRLHGIRIRKARFHLHTFVELKMHLPEDQGQIADYFDRARRKRNAAAYDRINVVSEGEVDDLIAQVEAFRVWVNAEVEERQRDKADV